MAKRSRWILDIQLELSPEQATECIQGYLDYKKYHYKQSKEGEMYFELNDVILGNRGFKYAISPDAILHLEAWVGNYGHEMDISDGKMTASAAKKAYMDELQNLLSQLSTVSGAESMGEYAAYAAPTTSAADVIQATAKKEDESNGKLAIWSLVMSLIFMVMSCFGFMIGGILIVLLIYFISKGMKSSKKGFSIAAIVISGVSILILIGNIVLSAMLN